MLYSTSVQTVNIKKINTNSS